MGQTVHLFIDTNILLHFHPINELPWDQIVQGDRIELIVTHVVVRDLDKHKNSNPSEKIRARARRVLNQIEGWTRSADGFEARPGVYIRTSFEVPTIDFNAYNLDDRWSDDCLLAIIKSFQLATGETLVWIVSDDTGIRIKAQYLGIKPLGLEDAHRLPLEPDPLELENNRLRQQVLKLSAPPIPALEVEFPDGQDFVRFPLPNAHNTEDVEHDVSSKLQEMKKKYRPYSEDDFLSLGMPLLTPKKQEIERYNAALPQYYSDYENYLRKIAFIDIRHSLTYEFSLQLSNVGRAPADDVDVQIDFPDGFSFREEDDQSESIKEPEAPPFPRSELQIARDSFMASSGPLGFPHSTGSLLRNLGTVSPPPNVSSATIRRTKSYEVSYRVRRLKHGFSVSLGTLAIYFGMYEDVQSFEADYEINAANMPENSKGKLRFAFVAPQAS
jgi:hypothetical protein